MLKRVNLDKFGMTASSICAVHCLLMPFIVAFLPFVGMSFFASTGFEWFILITAVIVASTSLCLGFKTHQKINPLIIAGFGFAVLFITRINLQLTSHESLTSALFLFIGGCCVACAHLINHKLCDSCIKCNHGP